MDRGGKVAAQNGRMSCLLLADWIEFLEDAIRVVGTGGCMPGKKEKDVDPLSRRFAAARAALGHSQIEVGASLNVSQRTVSNWERGVPPPSLVQVEFLERRAAELLTASRP